MRCTRQRAAPAPQGSRPICASRPLSVTTRGRGGSLEKEGLTIIDATIVMWAIRETVDMRRNDMNVSDVMVAMHGGSGVSACR